MPLIMATHYSQPLNKILKPWTEEKKGSWQRVFQVRLQATITRAGVFLLSRFSAAQLFILNEGHQALSNSSHQVWRDRTFHSFGNINYDVLLLLGKSHGQRSLVDYSSWDHKELDTTERFHFHFHFCLGSLRDVMFRETGGVVVEESAKVRRLQERTLEEPAVHSQRQQVFWGRGVLGPCFRDFRLTLQFLTVILGGVRYFSFQMFGNRRMREWLCAWVVSSAHSALLSSVPSVVMQRRPQVSELLLQTEKWVRAQFQVFINISFSLLYSVGTLEFGFVIFWWMQHNQKAFQNLLRSQVQSK